MWQRALIPVLLVATLAGCGFHLRGGGSLLSGGAVLPFDSLYIEGGQEIAISLQRAIRPTATKVTAEAKLAQAILQITEESREKRILSLDRAGRVSEFRLFYRVGFKVRDNQGRALMNDQLVELTREITFNDAQTLAKESEEALLYRDMQSDAVQQIVRRLSVARPAP